ncbi:MAG: hypothetical protein CVV42_00435 [Candidatus Riflebacteria bacterium HGW-Riflebacteria-2]|nr:MAG: hypothetical protein CVV42_00435 [Candidatus Riflebacteria bacterium HGW-Riflebacteria-2]
MRKITLLVLCLWLGCAAMLAAQSETEKADILFAKYYINWAWGFDFKGITVDSAGQVYTFAYDESVQMPELDRNALTSDQLKTLYEPGKKLITTVAPDKLQQMIALVPAAAVASISERVHGACDKGSYASVAYIPDTQTNLFKEINLKTEGDWNSHNLAPEAAEIVEWLNSLKQN